MHFVEEPAECHYDSSLKTKSYQLHGTCFNYSAKFKTEFAYYIAIHVSQVKVEYCQKIQKTVSSKDASEICSQTGGVLPIFRNTKDLHKFLAMLKLSPYILTTSGDKAPSLEQFEFIFIGLKANKHHVVSNFIPCNFISCRRTVSI